MKNIVKKGLLLTVFKGGKDSIKKVEKEDFPYMDLIGDDDIMFYRGKSFYGQTNLAGAIEMLKEFDGYRMTDETHEAICKKYNEMVSV